MQETLKMMKSILTGKENELTEKELIEEYKQYKSPNILAYFFIKNYTLAIRTSTFFINLNNEDIASFCLFELDNCLNNFDYNYNIQFNTYFIRCLKNRFIIETKLLNTHGRKALTNYADIEKLNLTNNSNIVENIDMILNNYKLTTTEKLQCKLLNAGYNCKEIAQILKQSINTIYDRNFKIKLKILNSNT